MAFTTGFVKVAGLGDLMGKVTKAFSGAPKANPASAAKAFAQKAADRATLRANPVGGYASIGKAPSTFAGSVPKRPLQTV
jgi:hypothetical protein